jgi:hypothetical protein
MVNRRGYYAKPGALNQVREGLAKSEVEAIMGSPSTTASVNLQGDSYYYISSVTTQRSFLDPQEQTREIIAIRFRPQRPGHKRRPVRPRGRTHHQHAGPQDTRGRAGIQHHQRAVPRQGWPCRQRDPQRPLTLRD